MKTTKKSEPVKGNEAGKDFVDVHATTINYMVDGSELAVFVSEYEIYEQGQGRLASLAKDQFTAVEFCAGISEGDAIDALQRVIDAIDETGLPETIRKMDRKNALLLKQAQDHAAELGSDLDKLSPEARTLLLPLLDGEQDHLEFRRKRPVGRRNGHDKE